MDAHEDVDEASEKFKKIYKTFLANEDMEKTSQQFKKVFKTLFADMPVAQKYAVQKKLKNTKTGTARKKVKSVKAK